MWSSPARSRAGLLWMLSALLAGCTDRTPSPLAPHARAAEESRPGRQAATTTLRWNTEAQTLAIGATPAAPVANRVYALVSIAEFAALEAAGGDDASRNVTHSAKPSGRAAEVAAAAMVLAYLYPNAASELETMMQADESMLMSSGDADGDVPAGDLLGRAVASAVVARARTDGSDRTVSLTIPVGPGYWTGNPVVPQWPTVRPFVLTSGSELRPPPPPAFGSSDFEAALAEVRAMSDAPTPAQMATIQFWFDPQAAGQHAGHWNRIAGDLITRHALDERAAARALMLMNVAISDATIACFDAKYFYWLIRPYQADPTIHTWLALPRHASYPSAHSCTAGGAVGVLGRLFEDDRGALEAMEHEDDESRILAGLHYRFDVETGSALGHAVARRVLDGGTDALTESAIDDARGFATIPNPGWFSMTALGINDEGAIVGRYQRIKGETHGFLRSPAGEYATIDFPGASFTVATSFNRQGDIGGQYSLPTDAKNTRRGFVREDGVFTSIEFPGAGFTNVLGIGTHRDVVGRYCVVAPALCGKGQGLGYFHGFLLRDGVFTTIDFPGSVETNLFKITSRGDILGEYLLADHSSHLFLLREGRFTTVSLPPGVEVSADNASIDARGDVAGTYCDAAPCVSASTDVHGFILTEDGFRRLDYPGASQSGAFGINDRRDVVGYYVDAQGQTHGFLSAAADREGRSGKR